MELQCGLCRTPARDKVASGGQARMIAEKVGSCLAQPYRLTVKHNDPADTVVPFFQLAASMKALMLSSWSGTLSAGA